MNEQCLSMKKLSTVLFTYILQFITHWAADKNNHKNYSL